MNTWKVFSPNKFLADHLAYNEDMAQLEKRLNRKIIFWLTNNYYHWYVKRNTVAYLIFLRIY